ncbi:MAG: insulinase family protein, partial [Actinobacteria bacterium]|nr:insulinase family protein [Actinomycetota bacterium]
TVVTERMPEVRSVTAGFWVATGSRDEAASLAGASHFLEHLLFKGTDTRSAKDIAESVDAVGGEINAFTTKEYTAFYVRLLAESLGLGIEILSDIMWSPALRPDEVEAERQVILEEILMNGDEPADHVHDVFFEALFPGHPLGREVLGDEGTVTALGRDDIDSFFRHHYRPGNIVMAAAGRLDHDEVVALVADGFAGPDAGAAPPRTAPTDPPRPVSVVNRPTEQAHLVMGMPALHRHHPDRYVLSALNHVLGGGMSSRLFQEIRENRGLAYSVYSYRTAFEGAGALAVYAGTSPPRAHEVVELIDAELGRLATAGVTAHELEMAKGHLKGTLALSMEDSASRMSRLGRGQLVHGDVIDVDELIARIDAVTIDDVGRVTGEVMGGHRVLAVVGPFDEDDFAPVSA